MQPATQSSHLLLTERGMLWLEQFAEHDRALVRQLTEAISLVSVMELERALQRLVERFSSNSAGPLALYSVREVPKNGGLNFRHGGNGLDAVASGSDIGSEGRIAHITRQICRTQTSQLLRQPDIDTLLKKRVRNIVVVDDIIGSGERALSYLQELWKDPSIKSWWSYGKVRFTVLAYAATEAGIRRVQSHPCKPHVEIHRHCPVLKNLPWRRELKRKVTDLCMRYARTKKLRGAPLGFGQTGALLVFEHGIPNNVPNIFWAYSQDPSAWLPLFPGRAATAEIASVFPSELAAREPVSVLLAAGAERMAEALPTVADRPLAPDMVVLLSLLRRGLNRLEAVADATGMTSTECSLLLERCIEAGLVSPKRRLTEKGAAELAGMAHAAPARGYRKLPLGEDSYYPRSLRGRIAG